MRSAPPSSIATIGVPATRCCGTTAAPSTVPPPLTRSATRAACTAPRWKARCRCWRRLHDMTRETIFITSPLEPEYVERIRAVDPDRIEVLYDPALLPPTRYRNDHKGGPFTRTPEQRARWLAMAAK